MVGVSAVVVAIGGVPDVHYVATEFEDRRVGHPVPKHVGPVGVCLITGVAGEAGGELEVPGVGDGVFEVISCQVGVDLPVEATAAGGGWPSELAEDTYRLRKVEGGIGSSTVVGVQMCDD